MCAIMSDYFDKLDTDEFSIDPHTNTEIKGSDFEDIKIDIEEHHLSYKSLGNLKNEDVEELTTTAAPLKSIVGCCNVGSEHELIRIGDPFRREVGIECGEKIKTESTIDTHICKESAITTTNLREDEFFVVNSEDAIGICYEWQQLLNCSSKTEDKENLQSQSEERHGLTTERSDETVEKCVKTCFECHHCQYSTRIQASLKSHIKYMHDRKNKGWHHCQFCSFQTKNKTSLRCHIKYIHIERTECQCHTCGFKTRNKLSLIGHIKYKHIIKPQQYQCEVCDFRTRNKMSLRNHVKYTHRKNVEWHQCQYCTYKTKFKPNLERHFKMIHQEKVEYYKCEFCETRVTDKSNLKRHIRYKHNIDKRFHCETCNFRTSHAYLLKEHFRISHDETAEWYYCHLCKYKSKVKGNLIKHIYNIHTDNDRKEQYFCLSCPYVTLHKTSLARHVKKKHDKKFCSLCEYNTETKMKLMCHMRKEHTQNNKKKRKKIYHKKKTKKKVHQCLFCKYSGRYKRCLASHVIAKHGNKYWTNNVEIKIESNND